MLRSLKDLERYTVSASDGEIGTVADFLVDDEHWTIRHLVVDTGGGFLELNGERVLISPIAFRQADWATRRFHLALTLEQIKHSPGECTDKPVSRQREHWRSHGDVHLRSAKEVGGYHIEGRNGSIGHVDDFVVDDETWEIRYLAVDTRDWMPGKKVLISPDWASRVDWPHKTVHLAMSRQQIKDSPVWNANLAVNREYEERLYDYHGRPVYWPDDAPRGEARWEHVRSHPG